MGMVGFVLRTLIFLVLLDYSLCAWSKWSSCGTDGEQHRERIKQSNRTWLTRKCKINKKKQVCLEKHSKCLRWSQRGYCTRNNYVKRNCPLSCGLCTKANGGYTQWSHFSTCSATCGVGKQIRFRRCEKPTPNAGGKNCDELGTNQQVVACKIKPCKVIRVPTKVCKNGILDFNIIIELPQKGLSTALRGVKNFIRSLVPQSEGKCWMPIISIATGQGSFSITTEDCYTDECALNEFKRLVTSMRKTGKWNSKINVLKKLVSLRETAEMIGKLPGLDGPRKTILLVLSTKPKKGRSLAKVIRPLMEIGYDFIAVGVGEGKKEKMEDFAYRGVTRIESFYELNEKSIGVKAALIKIDKRYLNYNVAEGIRCKNKVDLCFLVDSSGSISKRNYEKIKEFIVKISSSFHISKEHTHASVVVYSDRIPNTYVAINLVEHYSNVGFRNAVANIPYVGYRTRMDLGFEVAEQQIFNVGNSSRSNAEKVIIKITDGIQYPRGEGQEKFDPAKVASGLLKQGVQIYTVGIGDGVDKNEMKDIAKDHEKVYSVKSYKKLNSKGFVEKVSRAVCETTTTSPPPSTIATTTTTPATTKPVTRKPTTRKTATRKTTTRKPTTRKHVTRKPKKTKQKKKATTKSIKRQTNAYLNSTAQTTNVSGTNKRDRVENQTIVTTHTPYNMTITIPQNISTELPQKNTSFVPTTPQNTTFSTKTFIAENVSTTLRYSAQSISKLKTTTEPRNKSSLLRKKTVPQNKTQVFKKKTKTSVKTTSPGVQTHPTVPLPALTPSNKKATRRLPKTESVTKSKLRTEMRRRSALPVMMDDIPSSTDHCKYMRDVNIIIEVGRKDINKTLRGVEAFSSSLASQARDQCWRPHITIAAFDIFHLTSKDCYSVKCVRDSIRRMHPVLIDRKEDWDVQVGLHKALKDIEQDVEESNHVPILDGGVRHLIILVCEDAPPHHFHKLVEGGYDIMGIQVGNSDTKQLKSLANKGVMHVKDFLELSQHKMNISIIISVINDTDKDLPTKEYEEPHQFKDSPRQEQHQCKGIVDICFLIDSSGSIGDEYPKILQLVGDISNSFSISKEGVHASVIVFSDRLPYTYISINLTQHYSNKEFVKAVQAIPYVGFRTRMDLAFAMAKDKVFTPEYGARPNASKIIIFLTDGVQDPKKDRKTGKLLHPLDIVEEMRGDKVNILAIGVTKEVDKHMLTNITRDPKKMFYAANYSMLLSKAFMKAIEDSACKVMHTSPTVPPAAPTTTVTTAGAKLSDVVVIDCKYMREVNVIIEVSQDNITNVLKGVKDFALLLAAIAEGQCWRPHITLAAYDLFHLATDNCYETDCVAKLIAKVFPKILAVQTDVWDVKESLHKALKDIEQDVDDADQLPVLDGGVRKLIVLVCAAAPPLHFHKLIEGGYDIIGLQIGNERDEFLDKLSNKGVLHVSNFSMLNDKNQDVVQLISVFNDSKIALPFKENEEEHEFTDNPIKDEHQCKAIVDICFIIDSSGSIGEEYPKVKQMVADISNSFTISKEGVHASVIVFSDRLPFTYITTNLTKYYTNKEFVAAVKATPYIGFRTRMDLAFKLAREKVFTVAYGARLHAKKIIVFITDGMQNPTKNKKTGASWDPVPITNKIRAEKIDIIAIGVTSGINKEVLLNITGDSAKMFYAADFDKLLTKDFLKSVSKEACEISLPKTTQAPTTTTTTTTKAMTTLSPPRPFDILVANRIFEKSYKGYTGKLRSVTVILEVSSFEKEEALLSIHTFIKVLFSGGKKVYWKLRVWVAAFELFELITEECLSVGCVTTTYASIELRIKQYRSAWNSRASVLKAFEILHNESSEHKKLLPGIDGGIKKNVLFVSHIAASFRININLLAEEGYDFFVTSIYNERSHSVNMVESTQFVQVMSYKQIETTFYQKIIITLNNSAKYISSANINLATRNGASGFSAQEKSTEILDICFLIDASGSILKSNYEKIKLFVSKLANSFFISKDVVHASVVLFGDTVPHSYVAIRLFDYYTNAEFEKAVKVLPYLGFGTRIDVAFKLAEKNVFTPQNGARLNAKKLVFLITDGLQHPQVAKIRGTSDPIISAQSLINRDVKVFVIGVGGSVDKKEMIEMVNVENRYFYTDSFNKLLVNNFIREIAKTSHSMLIKNGEWSQWSLCVASKQSRSRWMPDGKVEPTTKTCQEFSIPCNGKHDINVIVEIPKSSTIQDVLEAIKQFLIRLVSRANESCWRVRIWFAGFQLFTFNTFDCYSLACVIENFDRINSTIRMNMARKTWLTKENILKSFQIIKMEEDTNDELPGADGPRKSIVLITSSKPKEGVDLRSGISMLKEGGFNFIIITIGEARRENLHRVTNNILHLQTFRQLNVRNRDIKSGDITSFIHNPDEKITTESMEFNFTTNLTQSTFEKLRKKVDICFLVDSSGSMSKLQYKKLIEFVGIVADRFSVSRNETHFGVVLFSDRFPLTYTFIKLNSYFSNAEFQNALKVAPYIGYRTRIDLAFKVAHEQIFNPHNGARKDADKIILLLTDGKQYPRNSPHGSVTYEATTHVRRLIKKGVHIFAVGITDQVNIDELNDITGNASRVFLVKTFKELFTGNVSAEVVQCFSDSMVRSVEILLDQEIPTTTIEPTTTAGLYSTESPYVSTSVQPSETTMILPTTVSSTTITGITTNITASRDKTVAPTNKTVTTPCATPVKATICQGVGSCATCCGGHDIYINIFQAGARPTFILNGMKLRKGDLGLKELDLPNDSSKNSINKALEMMDGSFPDRSTVSSILAGIMNTKRRTRRHALLTDHEKYTWRMIEAGKKAGCALFLHDLERSGYLDDLQYNMRKQNNITIFCPRDESYKRYLEGNHQGGLSRGVSREGSILASHVALKQDHHGIIYRTLNGGKVVMQIVGDDSNKISWRANNADVIKTFKQDSCELIITKEIIHPYTKDIVQELKSNNKRITIFNKIANKHRIEKLFNTVKPTKRVCFSQKECVAISQSVQSHLRESIRNKHFTVLAPTDGVFRNMTKSRMSLLRSDKTARIEFLREHVFIGVIGEMESNEQQSTKYRGVAYSLTTPSTVLTINKNKDGSLLLVHGEKLYRVHKSVQVAQGVLHIVDAVV